MEELIVVTHPEPIRLEVRYIETEPVDDGSVALAYYHDGNLLARGSVASEAVKAIRGILKNPVSVALAATNDDSGNIDARFCLVLPMDSDKLPLEEDDDEAPEEPWKQSVPAVPTFESSFTNEDLDEEGRPRVALLPIGNIVRPANDRHHPDDIARDLRDMLINLMDGKARDAVDKAIDDLLNNL
jgi:hypothetical protein